jgi:hypothetical protein
MQQSMSTIVTKFLEAAATSIAAHLAAWIAIISITAAWQFLGHVTGGVVLHLVFKL